MTLEAFLAQTCTPATVKIYCLDIRRFIDYLGAEQARRAAYPDIVAYLEHLRRSYDNPGTVNRILCAIKQYYFYLIQCEQRADHPCRRLYIRDHHASPIQIQDLLSPQELERLLEREERYPLLTLRNRVVSSLLVRQALLKAEICALTLEDVDLEAAQVHVRPTRKTNARTLPLEARQSVWLYRYIHQVRPKLLRGDTQSLVITARGTAERGEGIGYLVETLRGAVPHKKITATTIRQSVIANMLKQGRDLRLVQVFAGHKHPKTTELYRQTGYEELKHSVDRFHPLSDSAFERD